MAEKTKGFLYGVISILIIYFLGTTIFKPTTYNSFYYPDANYLADYVVGPVYPTIEECREWAKDQVRIYNPKGGNYDYECGKNCKMELYSSRFMCEESTR